MNFIKFWNLVARYPWLPRIICPVEYIIGPRSTADFLGKSSLGKKISYIAFRPWHSLPNLQTTPDSDDVVIKRPGVYANASMCVYYRCFWHLGREYEFNREIHSVAGRGELKKSSHNNCVEIGEVTINQALLEIATRGGIVDAVIKQTSLAGRVLKLSGDETLDFINSIGSEETVISSYDIYLPPPKKRTSR